MIIKPYIEFVKPSSSQISWTKQTIIFFDITVSIHPSILIFLFSLLKLWIIWEMKDVEILKRCGDTSENLVSNSSGKLLGLSFLMFYSRTSFNVSSSKWEGLTWNFSLLSLSISKYILSTAFSLLIFYVFSIRFWGESN